MFEKDGPTFIELADQALSSTDVGYEKLATKFDKTPFRTPDVVLDPVGAFLRRGVPIGSAIDFCTGTGAGLEMLRPLVTEQLVGIDRVTPMLDQAKENLNAGSKNVPIEYWQGDVLSHPFEPVFDLVVSFGAFGHILAADESTLVRQIYRALKPGGRFVFVTGYLPKPWHPVVWLARGFNGAMRIRNALIRPPFIMYYLTFMLPKCRHLLEGEGFEVREHKGLWTQRWGRNLVLVEATKAML